MSPLLFNVVFAAVVIVVLQRFTEDPLIVLYLVFLDDAPKGEDSRPREEGTLGCSASGVGDAVCRRCGGGVDIVTWSYQDEERYSCRISGIRTDNVEEEDRGHVPVVRSKYSVKRAAN